MHHMLVFQRPVTNIHAALCTTTTHPFTICKHFLKIVHKFASPCLPVFPHKQELKSSQEAVTMLQREEESDPWNRAMGSRSAAAASDMRAAIETGERELVELRTMVIRKGSYLLVTCNAFL